MHHFFQVLKKHKVSFLPLKGGGGSLFLLLLLLSLPFLRSAKDGRCKNLSLKSPHRRQWRLMTSLRLRKYLSVRLRI